MMIRVGLFTVMFKWYQVEIQQTEVVKLVASISPIMGLFLLFDGWNSVTGGILRAKGAQVRTYILEISSRNSKKKITCSFLVPY